MTAFGSIDQASAHPAVAEAHREIWSRLGQPGCWWAGAERIAIAQASRDARSCLACQKLKAALSPEGDHGEHTPVDGQPAATIEAVHRIVSDPSRLSAGWLERLRKQGISTEHYVELLGIVVAMVSIDGFHRALGLPLEPLPSAEAGEPSRYRPIGAADSGAWVPTVQPQDAGPNEADLYPGGRTGNVISAMSLVPDSVRMLITLSDAHYIPMASVMTPGDNGGRDLSRSQIELLAGRVSSVSDCFY